MNKSTKIFIVIISLIFLSCLHEAPEIFYFNGTGFTPMGIIPEGENFAGYELINCHKGFVPDQLANIDNVKILFPIESKEDWRYVEIKFQKSNKYGLSFYHGKTAIYFYPMKQHEVFDLKNNLVEIMIEMNCVVKNN